MKYKTKSVLGLILLLGIVGLCFGLNAKIANKNIQLLQSPSSYVLMNKSKNTIECAQMIGGYCSNNPVKAGQKTRILPDPGSQIVRGHIMVMGPNVTGHYVGNVLLAVQQTKGVWQASLTALYNQQNVKNMAFVLAK